MKYSIQVSFNNGWKESDKVEVYGLTDYAAFNKITDDVIKCYKKKGKNVILVDYHNASKSFYFEQLRSE
jgi:hypothetical protein